MSMSGLRLDLSLFSLALVGLDGRWEGVVITISNMHCPSPSTNAHLVFNAVRAGEGRV